MLTSVEVEGVLVKNQAYGLLEPERVAAEAEELGGGASFADPVFVLCNGRSGSTLLRFLLDAHPELACPPETNLPVLCVQLATVWSLIEGAPLSANRGDEPPEIPEAAIAGVRHTMDRMLGSYLGRRGKKRYCDKSLGTAGYADLLLRVYPDARFICVYRHPMDVIASGLEACPWGLNGYGFDPYIAATPGNAVMALASFWADNARATLAAEERLADRCFRLRYEDLVTDPEDVAANLFAFLGVAQAPGISEVCFSAERERWGPADYKIWYTSKVSSDSIGRGWSVPTGMIAPQLLGAINELAGKLGYRAVDDEWGTTEPPTDLRVPITASPGADEETADPDGQAVPAGEDAPGTEGEASSASEVAVGTVSAGPYRSQRLGDRLGAGLATALGDSAGKRYEQHGTESFVAVALTKDSARPAEYWLVDLGAATVTPAAQQAQENSDWDMIGTLDTWEQVLDDRVNLSVALRSCRLRYCDNGESSALAADSRIWIMAQLLGLASWRMTSS
jgi:protein-tyrosine sulfotransferase